MPSSLGTYVTYNPLAVSPRTRIDELLQMIETLSMHHFPVVDEDQQLVGIVSETDLILDARQRMRTSGSDEGRPPRVKDLLTGDVFTIDHLAPPRQALRMLMENFVRSLAVLENGKLVGIITISDFLREFSYGQMTCAKEPVSDFLESPADPLEPDLTADEALAALKNSGAEHLAVVQGGCPVGVVSGREILKAIAMTEGGHLTGKSPILRFVRKTPAFRPGQRMSEAAALMLDHGLSALAVTNQANRFLGIISADQVLKTMLRSLKD